ncbi:MAG TPA: type II toxin-antitoxin system RelE/ParE family toxin [Spirochaetota bacterium]|nr:type II toxin-antitoxin system RelE/ParE family toxin [Spirochaetota bacterium]HPV40371.1 type II toxin-antitoxin system RelE/ParE family toxin [Spirochaetota bacterium]
MPRSLYTVFWTETAHDDLEGIINYISLNTVENAVAILYKIKEKAETLYSFPDRGRIVPELKFHGIEHYRELILNPWRIIYKIDNNRVYVLSVLDGRRNLEDILLERLIK